MTKHRVRRRRRDHRGVKLLDLPGRGFVCRWTDPLDGRLCQQSMAPLGITNKIAALTWAKSKSKAVLADRAAFAIGGTLSVRAPLRESLATYLEGFTKKNTLKAKTGTLSKFAAHLEALGVQDMASIKAPLLARWSDSIARGGLKVSTANLNRSTVSAWMNWGLLRGECPYLSKDTVAAALKRARVPRDAIVFLRPDELRKVLETALRHDAANPTVLPTAPILLMEVTTGMRLEEVLGLEWSEWDQEAKAIRLPAGRAKVDQARVIGLDISPTASELLRSLRLRTRGKRVFPDWTASRWKDAKKRLTKMGAPTFVLRDIRRSVGTLLACAPGIGLNAWNVAQRMGHTVQIAEKHYVGALSGISPTAKTVEAAAGLEAVAKKIIKAAGGVLRGQVAEASGGG